MDFSSFHSSPNYPCFGNSTIILNHGSISDDTTSDRGLVIPQEKDQRRCCNCNPVVEGGVQKGNGIVKVNIPISYSEINHVHVTTNIQPIELLAVDFYQ